MTFCAFTRRALLPGLTFTLCSLALADPAPPVPSTTREAAGTPKPVRNPVRSKETGRVWPAQAGEASICLWAEDKLAALSLTIDDNSAPDVDWWLEKSREAGIPLTWFLVTNGIDKQSFAGTWALWKRVLEAGHAVESHTVTHLSGASHSTSWKGIEWEYSESIRHLEAGLPGHRVHFLAYPGGGNSKMNDPQVAAGHYLAARGTVGTLNGPRGINYMQVNAMSSPGFDPARPYNNLHNLLNPQDKGYRGWAVIIYHLVKDKVKAQKHLDFYAANQRDIWAGKFGDVARYAQQREAATIQVTENTAARITLQLKDTKDDALFSYPLTVKVRLPDAWGTVLATQNGTPTECGVVENEGARFALVKAVPDRGPVVLTAG